jgi:hypothetical protein
MKERVIVSFEGEPLAFYKDEKTKYQLYRYLEGDKDTFFIHWQDDEGAWLETGRLGDGVDAEMVAAMWPELAARAWAIANRPDAEEEES